jgi:hypothetical protein
MSWRATIFIREARWWGTQQSQQAHDDPAGTGSIRYGTVPVSSAAGCLCPSSSTLRIRRLVVGSFAHTRISPSLPDVSWIQYDRATASLALLLLVVANHHGRSSPLLSVFPAFPMTHRPPPLSFRVQTCPVQSSPVQFSSVQSSPIQFSPVQSSPIRLVLRIRLILCFVVLVFLIRAWCCTGSVHPFSHSTALFQRHIPILLSCAPFSVSSCDSGAST